MGNTTTVNGKIFTENPEIKLSKNIRFLIKIHNVMKIRKDNDYNYDFFVALRTNVGHGLLILKVF
jgi:hypothetical protein